MQITDPRTLRALAHPLRITLFERLAIAGSATATELAEQVGSTPSNCSFHLRTLADAGFIERVPGHGGRNRPWRVIDVSQSWDPAQLDEEGAAAARALEDALADWDHARRKVAARQPRPEGWERKLMSSSATLLLTPEESEELGERIGELVNRYVPRWENPEARPEGALPVRFVAHTYLVPEAGEQP